MKFSIITAVKNNKVSLQRAIASVRAQSYKNYEHIIVDGASTDGTLDFIKEIADDNTKWISEPDDGIYDALNKGIKLAAGDVIGLLHSDDFYPDEDVLARYAEAFGTGVNSPEFGVRRDSSLITPPYTGDRQNDSSVFVILNELNDPGLGGDSSVASLSQNDSAQQSKGNLAKVETVYSDLVYVGRSSGLKVEWKEVGEPANRRMGEELGKSSESVRSWKFDVQSSELNKSLKDQKIIRLWKAHSITKNTDHRSLITDNLLRKGWMPPHPTLFIRKEVFEKYGLYRTDMKIAADYEMILRLFYKYKISSYYLPVVTYCMTAGGASNKSLGNIITKSSEDFKALKMHGFRLPLITLFYKNVKKIPQFFLI